MQRTKSSGGSFKAEASVNKRESSTGQNSFRMWRQGTRALGAIGAIGAIGAMKGFARDRNDSATESDAMNAPPPPPALNRPQLAPVDCWLIRTPCFKFVMRQASNLLLAVLVTNVDLRALDPATANDPASAGGVEPSDQERTRLVLLYYLLLTWAIGGCTADYRQLAPSRERLLAELLSVVRKDVPSHYRKDTFNMVEFIANHLMLFALLLPTSMHFEASCVWSLAATFCWLRLMRVLTLSASLGPLTLMMVRMLSDVAKLLVIETFVVISFSAGIFVLYRGVDTPFSDEVAEQAADILTVIHPLHPLHDCEPMLDMHGGVEHRTWRGFLFALANGAVQGDGYLACLLNETGKAWQLAWAYAFSFQLLTGILLLNVLIAMMAKTFDDVWEASEVNHQFLFARLLFVQLERTPEPPPLNVLRLPMYVCNVFIHAIVLPLTSCSSALHKRVARAGAFLATGFVQSSIDMSKSRSNCHETTGEYVGTSFEGHNSWEAWKAAMSVEDMRDFLLGFLVRHEDDVAQEGRWRAKMLKRITGQFAQLEFRIENIVQETLQKALQPNAAPAKAAVETRLAEARRHSSLAMHGVNAKLVTLETFSKLAALDEERTDTTKNTDAGGISAVGDVPGSSCSPENGEGGTPWDVGFTPRTVLQRCDGATASPARPELSSGFKGAAETMKDLFSFMAPRQAEQVSTTSRRQSV